MSSNNVHPIDAHVGASIRSRRKALAMSQQELAKRLGITFQQVQKYEHGANRVGGSRLYEIAVALDCPVAGFFPPRDTPATEPPLVLTPAEREMILQARAIKPKQLKTVLDVLSSFSTTQASDVAGTQTPAVAEMEKAA